MAGSTPVYGFPYPTGTDRVMDGDNAIAALAQAIEDRLAVWPPVRMQAGTSPAFPSINGGTGQSLAMTFAVGRFTQTPMITLAGVSNGHMAASLGTGASATGCTLRIYNPTGTVISSPYCMFSAVQMSEASGPGLTRELLEGEAQYLATCHTDGCDNAGEPIPIVWAELDGPIVVGCGVCGQPIEDVTA